MRKFTIKNGKERIDLLINNYKLIIGSNFGQKFKIIQNIRSFFLEESEFSLENNHSVELYIDDEKISKKFAYYELNFYYDLKSDFKLGTKSLITKYLQLQLETNDYFEEINMINLSLKSLAMSFNVSKNLIDISFDEYTSKTLLKIIHPYIMIDDFVASIEDLSYEEYFLLILNLIKEINEKDLKNQSIFILDIPLITSKIYESINNMKNNNIMLIMTQNKKNIAEIENIYICDELLLDLADEQMLYETFCENTGKMYSMEDIKKMIKNKLEENTTVKTDFIAKILNI